MANKTEIIRNGVEHITIPHYINDYDISNLNSYEKVILIQILYDESKTKNEIMQELKFPRKVFNDNWKSLLNKCM